MGAIFDCNISVINVFAPDTVCICVYKRCRLKDIYQLTRRQKVREKRATVPFVPRGIENIAEVNNAKGKSGGFPWGYILYGHKNKIKVFREFRVAFHNSTLKTERQQLFRVFKNNL